jgi:hypothetical protein
MKSIFCSFATILVLTSAVALGWNQNKKAPPPRGGGPLPPPRVESVTRDGYRYVFSNGIPNHAIGRFPNRNNPNFVREQRNEFRMPVEPQAAEESMPLPLGPFGIAVNGILFDPGAAEFWKLDPNSGWQYEALGGGVNLGLDQNNAHVQPTGAYHYHGLPVGLIAKLVAGKKGSDSKMVLLGYAADGYPIYSQFGFTDANDAQSDMKKLRPSYQLKQGTRPNGPGGRYDGEFVQDYEYVNGSGDLDECNGRVAVTPENPDGIYAYHITEEFPFIPRRFHGTPDNSFRRGPGGPGRPPRPPR